MSEKQHPITENEVIAAAETLQAAGIKITILAVREKLGRGSFTTVKKFLDRWQSSTEPEQQQQPVPPQLESLWNEARRAADANLASERESLNDLAFELETRLASMEEAVVKSENARLLADARLADKSAELDRASAALEDHRRQRDYLQSKLENAEIALSQERTSWTSQMKELSERLFALNKAQAALSDQGTAFNEALRVSSDELLSEFATFAENESRHRASNTELMTSHLARLLEPLTGIPSRLTEVNRYAQLLHRQLKVTGFKSRSGR